MFVGVYGSDSSGQWRRGAAPTVARPNFSDNVTTDHEHVHDQVNVHVDVHVLVVVVVRGFFICRR
jgi:hypothetical protein